MYLYSSNVHRESTCYCRVGSELHCVSRTSCVVTTEHPCCLDPRGCIVCDSRTEELCLMKAFIDTLLHHELDLLTCEWSVYGTHKAPHTSVCSKRCDNVKCCLVVDPIAVDPMVHQSDEGTVGSSVVPAVKGHRC